MSRFNREGLAPEGCKLMDLMTDSLCDMSMNQLIEENDRLRYLSDNYKSADKGGLESLLDQQDAVVSLMMVRATQLRTGVEVSALPPARQGNETSPPAPPAPRTTAPKVAAPKVTTPKTTSAPKGAVPKTSLHGVSAPKPASPRRLPSCHNEYPPRVRLTRAQALLASSARFQHPELVVEAHRLISCMPDKLRGMNMHDLAAEDLTLQELARDYTHDHLSRIEDILDRQKAIQLLLLVQANWLRADFPDLPIPPQGGEGRMKVSAQLRRVMRMSNGASPAGSSETSESGPSPADYEDEMITMAWMFPELGTEDYTLIADEDLTYEENFAIATAPQRKLKPLADLKENDRQLVQNLLSGAATTAAMSPGVSQWPNEEEISTTTLKTVPTAPTLPKLSKADQRLVASAFPPFSAPDEDSISGPDSPQTLALRATAAEEFRPEDHPLLKVSARAGRGIPSYAVHHARQQAAARHEEERAAALRRPSATAGVPKVAKRPGFKKADMQLFSGMFSVVDDAPVVGQVSLVIQPTPPAQVENDFAPQSPPQPPPRNPGGKPPGGKARKHKASYRDDAQE
jgi:hypothetical protein